jgi:cytochrome c oxidase subunit 1
LTAPKPAAPGPRKANIRLALGWFAAAALLLLADGIVTFRPRGLDGADTYFVVVHRSWTLSMPAAFALFGALYLGMTPGFPVRLRPALGWAHLAVMAIGAVMTKAPQLALLWTGLPKPGEDPAQAFDIWNGVATAGAVLMGLSLLLFFWALIEGLRRRPSGTS